MVEDPQVRLLHGGDLRQQGKVVSRELVHDIIAYDYHLDLFHIVHLIHLHRALINDVKHARLIDAGVKPFRIKSLENAVGEIVAFLKAHVISAHQHQADVCALEADVNVKHELLGTPWHTDRRPGLTRAH